MIRTAPFLAIALTALLAACSQAPEAPVTSVPAETQAQADVKAATKFKSARDDYQPRDTKLVTPDESGKPKTSQESAKSSD